MPRGAADVENLRVVKVKPLRFLAASASSADVGPDPVREMSG